MRQGIVIGIAGASGSGKTLVAERIVDHLGADKAVVIQEDSYYKDLSDIPGPDRGGINFDHPDAFDHGLLVVQMQQLLSGEKISQPITDYRTRCRLRGTKRVVPVSIIIVEGILIFSLAQLRDLMDIRVFVDTPLDICFTRRLERDVTERGRTLDSVIAQYRETVRPMYLQCVEPTKRYADILIPRGGRNDVAIDLLVSRIHDMLADHHQGTGKK